MLSEVVVGRTVMNDAMGCRLDNLTPSQRNLIGADNSSSCVLADVAFASNIPPMIIAARYRKYVLEANTSSVQCTRE